MSKICIIENCGKRHEAKGYCPMHYRRFKLYGSPIKMHPKMHGMVETSEYGSWHQMIQRCNNANHKSYKNYGGRGIKVCKEWKDFKNFYADMGSKPTIKYSIDRIDNNGDYNKNNCRWATPREQIMNTRVRSDNTSSYRGVTFIKSTGHWQAQTTHNNKALYIGVSETAEEASEMYKKYRMEIDK